VSACKRAQLCVGKCARALSVAVVNSTVLTSAHSCHAVGFAHRHYTSVLLLHGVTRKENKRGLAAHAATNVRASTTAATATAAAIDGCMRWQLLLSTCARLYHKGRER
jgi:hypothetical protein